MKTCSECTRSSENKRFDCPPRMSDGRHFTDYRPRCLTNNVLPSDQPMTSFEYRSYLISNADTLMKKDRADAYAKNMCGPCVEPFDQGTMIPEHTITQCDANVCKFFTNEENGIGLGRMYTNEKTNIAKERFLKEKEQEQSLLKKKANCCVPIGTDDYYPIGYIDNNAIGRYATPSGGLPYEANDVWPVKM